MGYLDSTTVTVDAVLTKKGRQILSQNGAALNVSHFTLSDQGVDYTLWNPDHPSGSAFYGTAIENMPNPEASPHSQYYYNRGILMTLGKNTIALPAMELSTDTIRIEQNMVPQPVTATVVGFAGGGALGTTALYGGQNVVSGEGIQVIIPDTNYLTVSNGGTAYDITGNALSFVAEQQIPTAKIYEMLGKGPSYDVTFQPAANLKEDKTLTITIVHLATGAYRNLEVTVAANFDSRRRTSPSATKG